MRRLAHARRATLAALGAGALLCAAGCGADGPATPPDTNDTPVRAEAPASDEIVRAGNHAERLDPFESPERTLSTIEETLTVMGLGPVAVETSPGERLWRLDLRPIAEAASEKGVGSTAVKVPVPSPAWLRCAVDAEGRYGSVSYIIKGGAVGKDPMLAEFISTLPYGVLNYRKTP